MINLFVTNNKSENNLIGSGLATMDFLCIVLQYRFVPYYFIRNYPERYGYSAA
jgi:hypothetical protein